MNSKNIDYTIQKINCFMGGKTSEIDLTKKDMLVITYIQDLYYNLKWYDKDKKYIKYVYNLIKDFLNYEYMETFDIYY